MPILSRYVIRAEVGATKLNISQLGRDSEIVCAPLVAVRDVDGKAIVAAIGNNAKAFADVAGHRIVNPFESSEPLLLEMDYACALFAHFLRELTNGFKLTAPEMELRLAERLTPLSEAEKDRCSELAYRIGVRSMRVMLGADSLSEPAFDDQRAGHGCLIIPKKPSKQ